MTGRNIWPVSLPFLVALFRDGGGTHAESHRSLVTPEELRAPGRKQQAVRDRGDVPSRFYQQGELLRLNTPRAFEPLREAAEERAGTREPGPLPGSRGMSFP